MNVNYKNKYLKYKKKYLDLKKMNNKSGGSFFRNTYKNYMAKKEINRHHRHKYHNNKLHWKNTLERKRKDLRGRKRKKKGIV